MAQYDISNISTSNNNRTILVDLSQHHHHQQDQHTKMLEAIKSDFRDKLPTISPEETIRSTLLWDIITGDNAVFAAIAGILGVCALVSVIMTLYILLKRKKRYERVVCADERLQDYFHQKPTDHYIDEEYENTFTGVSIPLMQDVSKV